MSGDWKFLNTTLNPKHSITHSSTYSERWKEEKWEYILTRFTSGPPELPNCKIKKHTHKGEYFTKKYEKSTSNPSIFVLDLSAEFFSHWHSGSLSNRREGKGGGLHVQGGTYPMSLLPGWLLRAHASLAVCRQACQQNGAGLGFNGLCRIRDTLFHTVCIADLLLLKSLEKLHVSVLGEASSEWEFHGTARKQQENTPLHYKCLWLYIYGTYVDHSIRLYVAHLPVVNTQLLAAPMYGADYPSCHGVSQGEGTSHGHHPLSWAYLGRFPQWYSGQTILMSNNES